MKNAEATFVRVARKIQAGLDEVDSYIDDLIVPARWCSGERVRIAVGRPGVHSLSRVIPKDFKKRYSQLPCLALSTKKDIVENKPASLLVVSLCKALNGRLHLYVEDRWPSRTSPDYNCEVANPACRKRQFMGTYQWQSTLWVVGLPVTEDWFEMSCLISIRLTA